VARPGPDVEVRSLPAGGAEFVAALANGQPLTEAAKSAINASPLFELSTNLSALLGAGVFVGYSFTDGAATIETQVRTT